MINKYKLFSVCLVLTMIAGGHAFGQEVVVATVTTTSTPPAEPVSKKGYPILPKGGDFGLGFNAIPFLEYAGNFLSGKTGTNTITTNTFVSNNSLNQQITGKYFLGSPDQSYTSLMAIRGRFRVADNNSVTRNVQPLDNLTIPDPNITVQDQFTSNTFRTELGVGLEWRRGSGRLYGIYGGEVNFLYSTNSSTAEYGNAFSVNNQTPTSTAYISGANAGERGVAVNGLKTVGAGVRAFVGVEYFFMPRMSLSGEFTYGLNYTTTGSGSTEFQGWNAITGTTYTRTVTNPGSRGFTLDTSNVGGAINLFFYF
jgi:hypothetical protein